MNSFGRASSFPWIGVGAGSAGDGVAVLEAIAVIRVVGTLDDATAVGVAATLVASSMEELAASGVGSSDAVAEAMIEAVVGEPAPVEAAGAAMDEATGAVPEPDPPHDATLPPGALYVVGSKPL